MAIHTDDAVLTLAQWLSPGFPIGAFAYSHGLEAAVDCGWVQDATGFEDWLKDVLDCGTGRTDALFVSAAFLAGDGEELADVDVTARAFAASAERLLESQNQGASFCRVLNAVWRSDLDDLLYPVALGAAAAREELPQELTVRMYLHAFAANLVGAAQRLLPLGQTAAQAILRRQFDLIAAIAVSERHGDMSRLSSTAFLSDVSAMKHETLYSRIFRT